MGSMDVEFLAAVQAPPQPRSVRARARRGSFFRFEAFWRLCCFGIWIFVAYTSWVAVFELTEMGCPIALEFFCFCTSFVAGACLLVQAVDCLVYRTYLPLRRRQQRAGDAETQPFDFIEPPSCLDECFRGCELYGFAVATLLCCSWLVVGLLWHRSRQTVCPEVPDHVSPASLEKMDMLVLANGLYVAWAVFLPGAGVVWGGILRSFF